MTGGEAFHDRQAGRGHAPGHRAGTHTRHAHAGGHCTDADHRRSGVAHVTIATATGGRSFEVRPVVWIAGLASASALVLATIAAAGYMMFRDDIVSSAWSRQARMEQAYEDRIAGLRSEIDRINSRQLLDQDTIEAKIDRLTRRQDELRGQDQRVISLLDKAHQQGMSVASSIAADAPLSRAEPVQSDTATLPASDHLPTETQQSPLSNPLGLPPGGLWPLRSSWSGDLGQMVAPTPAAITTDRRPRQSSAERVAAIEASLADIAASQVRTIAAVTGMAERNSHVIETVVGKLGLRMAEAEPPRVPAARPTAAPTGVGGPLVPIVDPMATLAHAEMALERLGQLRHRVGLLPLGQPVRGPIEVTSPFGERPDPFLGVLAMHTGVDFRAGYGDAVVATGAGTVTEVGRQGGYGNMVEIDHGNGVATRYGHLSRFAVVVGQRVKAGQVIAYVGSTGRSTAPHLHYETRIGSEAVNPVSYLEAGNRLRPLLN